MILSNFKELKVRSLLYIFRIYNISVLCLLSEMEAWYIALIQGSLRRFQPCTDVSTSELKLNRSIKPLWFSLYMYIV